MNKVTSLYMKSRNAYLKKRYFSAIMYKRILRLFYSCEIPYTADIHKTVNFAHNGLGVVINSSSVIGENTIIYQNVTIGNRNSSDGPKIGKNVLIGANSVIIGNITIGDNAKIGAGALVVKDVPEGATVVSEPSKIIKVNGEIYE